MSVHPAMRLGPMSRLEGTDPPMPVEGEPLAVEAPLEMVVAGETLAVIMRTPGHDLELATGLLWSEGVLTSAADIQHSSQVGERLELELAPQALVRRERARRTMFATSACGICGKAAIGEVVRRFPLVWEAEPVSRRVVYALPPKLRQAQQGFARTGGLHAAALFEADGRLVACREDVGRHNALDKLLGLCLEQGRIPASQGILLVSGRASYELVAKAVALGVPIMAAVSAPSTLAVDLARAARLTLIGFLRDERMNVYTHPERVGM